MLTRKRIAILLVAIAFVGFIDASYLTIQHFQGSVPPCTVIKGCDRVVTSSYATIIGVPVALLGSVYYLAVLCMGVLYLQHRSARLFKQLKQLTFVGVIASAYFVYIQLLVIGAVCFYCMISVATSLLLFTVVRLRSSDSEIAAG